MDSAWNEVLTRTYRQSRRELRSYLTRMVLRPDVAEELVQQAAVKLIEVERADSGAPSDAEGMRAWLFRVATNHRPLAPPQHLARRHHARDARSGRPHRVVPRRIAFAARFRGGLAGREYAVGNAITIADYSLIHLEMFKEGVPFDWSPHANLHAYYERMRLVPHWARTAPPSREAIGRRPQAAPSALAGA